jgi:hypothetical protein
MIGGAVTYALSKDGIGGRRWISGCGAEYLS